VDTYTVTFASPVTNTVFHFLNLDSSQQIFTGATDGNGNPISGTDLATSFSVLNGNNALTTTISGGQFVVHPNPFTGVFVGCQSNLGDNPNGACGSVLLSGTYSSVTWYGTDFDPSASAGDGWLLQISKTPEPGTLGLVGTAVSVLAGFGLRSGFGRGHSSQHFGASRQSARTKSDNPAAKPNITMPESRRSEATMNPTRR
jgi:hypothetical protein